MTEQENTGGAVLYTPEETPKPKKRGRPAKKAAAEKKMHPQVGNFVPDQEVMPAETEAEETARWNAIRERREKLKQERGRLGSPLTLRLASPPRNGFARRWCNDDGNNIDFMLAEGYDFVRKGSSGTTGIYSTDPGDRISQLVGTSQTGEPLRAYLMETPEDFRTDSETGREDFRQNQLAKLQRVQYGGDKGIGGTDSRSSMYDPTSGNSQFDVT